MEQLVLTIIRRSISASWLILAVLLLRWALKRAPKWISCTMWALVALRLLCPISIESPWSLVPGPPPVVEGQFAAEPSTHGDLASEPSTHQNPPAHQPTKPNANSHVPRSAYAPAAAVWAAGVVCMGAYGGVGYILLRKKVAASLPVGDSIWLCDQIPAPFLLGLIRPRIYIPSGTRESCLPHIIAHERAHLKRRDHWWKALGFAVLALHWFNPLVWAAYVLLCRDIELACDEKVVRDLSRGDSIAYSEALLACSVHKRTILVCPLAFGEVGVKERVRRVLHYQKPAFWVVLASVAACAVLAVCFLTDQQSPFPVDLDQVEITEAVTQHVYFNGGPSTHRLSPSETEELASRLQSLRVGQREPDLQGRSPLYSLTVDTKQAGQLTFSGFGAAGGQTAVRCDDVYYHISDGDFIAYLQHICTGQNRAEASRRYSADLDRDGEEEDIVVTWDAAHQTVSVYKGGALIWLEEGADAHPGWKGLFLCHSQDGDCLLRYSPTMYQGACCYSYQLFTLRAGQEQVVDEGQVEFDLNFQSPQHGPFDPEAIAGLVERVNGYLSTSEALLVTDPNLLNTFEQNGALKDDLWFLDLDTEGFVRDRAASLQENLAAFAACQMERRGPA